MAENNTATKNPGVPSSSSLPPRQNEIVGYHEAFTFGGPHLGNNVAKVVHQSFKLGHDVLNGLSSTLGNTSLSYREWGLITVAALTAMGDTTDQLNVYVEGALRHGVQVEEVVDVFHHAQAFAGNPRAINALRATWSTLSNAREIPLPDAYTESLVRLGDHDTMVRDTHGPGVPIVLIHALCLDSRMWKDILPELAASTNARVIAYDLRGHGYARGAPLTQNLEQLATDLSTLLSVLSVEKADIYGASYGGAVAQYFALDHQSHTRSLTVMASAATATASLATRADRAEQSGILSLLPESLIRWFHPETIAANPWCVRYARHCVESARVDDWAAAWRAMSRLNTLPRLHELQNIPVLSLSGTHDVSSKPELMRAIVDACKENPNAEFVSVEKGTHMMAIEDGKAVVGELVRFREKVDRLGV